MSIPPPFHHHFTNIVWQRIQNSFASKFAKKSFEKLRWLGREVTEILVLEIWWCEEAGTASSSSMKEERILLSVASVASPRFIVSRIESRLRNEMFLSSSAMFWFSKERLCRQPGQRHKRQEQEDQESSGGSRQHLPCEISLKNLISSHSRIVARD